MESIQIHTLSKNYRVHIGKDVRKEINSFLLNDMHAVTKVLIITDETVAGLHLDELISLLNNWNPIVYTAPSGENAKTFEVYYDALTTALENRLDRNSVILALGGGAVGDLAGFVAASFMRGISFIQIPTTILAHDSAVGGKVAINHPLGKNMIGAFHQPAAVFYDLELLRTLPKREIRSGFAEVIKHSLINDTVFYQWLRNNVGNLDTLTNEQLFEALKKGIEIKSKFIYEDERETGVRAHLNFGHTLGHAIEAEMGYGKITHGEAIMIGMVFALKLSNDVLGLSFEIDKFINWVQSLGYSTAIPEKLSPKRLLSKMKQDKKSVNEAIRFVLLDQVGNPKLQELSDDLILEQLKRF